MARMPAVSADGHERRRDSDTDGRSGRAGTMLGIAASARHSAPRVEVSGISGDLLSRQPEMPDQNPEPENGRGEQAGRLQEPAEDPGD